MILEVVMHESVANFRGKQQILIKWHKYFLVATGIYYINDKPQTTDILKGSYSSDQTHKKRIRRNKYEEDIQMLKYYPT